MRLRHIIAHLKAQNWIAVTLDFVIVVIGVFVGPTLLAVGFELFKLWTAPAAVPVSNDTASAATVMT